MGFKMWIGEYGFATNSAPLWGLDWKIGFGFYYDFTPKGV